MRPVLWFFENEAGTGADFRDALYGHCTLPPSFAAGTAPARTTASQHRGLGFVVELFLGEGLDAVGELAAEYDGVRPDIEAGGDGVGVQAVQVPVTKRRTSARCSRSCPTSYLPAYPGAPLH
ncbi:hypothetical protein [Streptomyces violens]|uniref:hypothetical protein n=1 Tax=Streptomyces violens TaxID=66377 RepID=UPI0012FEF3D8|nr:hypothetical protein [Streptomyces violens]